MSQNLNQLVTEICSKYGNDHTRIIDIVRDIQSQAGCVSHAAMKIVGEQVGVGQVDISSVISFYSHLSQKKKGKVVVRLCDDYMDRMYGADKVAKVFEEELGVGFGATSQDGLVSLEYAPCIGMCDQPPAAMINDKVVTSITEDMARSIANHVKSKGTLEGLELPEGEGNNKNPLVGVTVKNNLRVKGDVVFSTFESGSALGKALAITPVEVIRNIKTSRLRGRGGAGFPAGMKWEFTRAAHGDQKWVICNADEGEPGTFKDRVILTEAPDLMFEGMTIAGYAIGAKNGILYLRGEYEYLHAYLEDVLDKRRSAGLLGTDILGKKGFDFDVRIQLGAGAYVCGEETALISSCEGTRGDPKNRPPFPAQKGYLGNPTSVNNVETFCAAARIMNNGAPWFAHLGSPGSSGLKLLSISGDCDKPGVYEVPFGTRIKDLLEMAGAKDTIAVQVGGASGRMISAKEFEKDICYDVLGTGGSIIIYSQGRDLLEVAMANTSFFEEESCGYCTPCRVGNVLMRKKMAKIMDGYGVPDDIEYLGNLATHIKTASRCGLGQTSSNPILTTLENFRELFVKKVNEPENGIKPSFDLEKAVALAANIIGREPTSVKKPGKTS